MIVKFGNLVQPRHFKWFSGDTSDGNNYWLSQADTKQREVIGNIYEHPHLLEQAA